MAVCIHVQTFKSGHMQCVFCFVCATSCCVYALASAAHWFVVASACVLFISLSRFPGCPELSSFADYRLRRESIHTRPL
jgi:hypothetical protein